MVLRSTSWLLLSQLANMAVPLLALPLLLKTTSLNDFGSFAICLSIVAYVQVFYEYSFTIIIPRYVNTEGKRSGSVFSCVVLYRLSLFFLFFILCSFVPSLRNSYLFYFFLHLFSLCFILPQLYLRTGFMQVYGFASFISKALLVTLVIFLYYQGELTIPRYILLLSFSSLILAIVMLVKTKRKFNIFNLSFSFDFLVEFLKSGINPFFASLVTSLYNNSTVLYLGYFYSSSAVAIYAIAEKYIRAAIGLASSLSVVIYNMNVNRNRALKLHGLEVGCFFVVYGMIYNFSELWSAFGIDYSDFNYRILFLIIPIALTSYFLQLNFLYRTNKDRLVLKLSLLAALLHITLSIITGLLDFYYLSLLVTIFVECMIFILSAYLVIKVGESNGKISG